MLLLAVLGCAFATRPYQTASVELPMPERRALPVRVTWPATEGPWPVVVFSHGLGGSRDAYDPLVQHWAEHGLLVVQPTHPDSVTFRTPAERARLRNPEELLKDPTIANAWLDRRVEVGAVLDRLDELARAAGIDPARIDHEHVGVGGHSYGAHTAMLAGGLTLFGPGGRARYHDPEERADAILLISPQGTGSGITAESYRGIEAPLLMITGSEDRSPVGDEGPQWRMEVWRGLPASERWLVWIEGAGHGFGGISGRMFGPEPAAPEQVRWVQQATLSFWQTELLGDAAAREWLDTGRLGAESGGKVRVEAGPAPRSGTPRRPHQRR